MFVLIKIVQFISIDNKYCTNYNGTKGGEKLWQNTTSIWSMQVIVKL